MTRTSISPNKNQVHYVSYMIDNIKDLKIDIDIRGIPRIK